jgi:hypothetical protein
LRSNPNPALSEFLIRLLETFKDKNITELASIALASAPELCEGRSHSALYQCIHRITINRKRADRKDVETAKKLLKGLPVRNGIDAYEIAEMRVQNKPMRNK